MTKINKYNLRQSLAAKLDAYKSTFRETSYDQINNCYLCNDESTEHVYCFDKYIRENCPHPYPASPDAIYIGNKDLYFVEFKNQNSSDINGKNLRKKFLLGTNELVNLLGNYKPRDCKFNFCVVFKIERKPKFFDFSPIERNVVRFGLDECNKMNNNFYDSIITQDIIFFKNKFADLQCA